LTTESETIDICIWVTLPKNYYETIAGLVRIAGFKTLDEWASVALRQDLEGIADGVVVGDMISEKMKGTHSPEYDALANAGKQE
jgi:hypothetical protein